MNVGSFAVFFAAGMAAVPVAAQGDRLVLAESGRRVLPAEVVVRGGALSPEGDGTLFWSADTVWLAPSGAAAVSPVCPEIVRAPLGAAFAANDLAASAPVIAIILGIAALTPDDAQAQLWDFDCATCDDFTGICEGGGSGVNDRCVMGIDWDEGEFYCASWGRLWCDPRIAFDEVGADGALLRERTFASSTSHEIGAQDSQAEYLRDCRSRIVARSYGSDEAEEMRRRTESIVI